MFVAVDEYLGEKDCALYGLGRDAALIVVLFQLVVFSRQKGGASGPALRQNSWGKRLI
jgi:hypothetical protein